MKSFKLDENNNIIFKNDFMLVDDESSIKQDVKNRLLMWKTEYPFNINEGINWYNLAMRNNVNEVKSEVKKRILQDKRIFSIISLEVVFKSGRLEITAELETESGVVNV